MSALLGCIADDYTGATDLSSMLVRAGLRVIQCFGVPDDPNTVKDVDAVVVSLKSRSITPDAAVAMSLAALEFLKSLGAERFFFKYCSTFDSTARGNIGPVADALADALRARTVLFCPAFPENGRTVYCGYLFVDGVLLDESGMRKHPLNPMTDSSLVRVLQSQSIRKVGRLPLYESSVSARQELSQGASGDVSEHLIADAITEQDLRRVAELARGHVFLTGGSAIARYWAETLQFARSSNMPLEPSQRNGSKGCVILAGSCSIATRQQVVEFEKIYPVQHVDLATAPSTEAAISQAVAWCQSQWAQPNQTNPLLVSSSARAEMVDAARSKFGEQAAAALAENFFAGLAQSLQRLGVNRFIVAGGETSGAVINALGVTSVRIGREIASGVPWITSTNQPWLALALKSGNFGGPRFFFDALELAT